MAAATTYAVGAVKQDSESLAVAVKVQDGLPGEWAVMIVDHGGHYATADEVADWPDITSKT
jgi:hypothetical protein